jgi:hypothetical protein
MKHLALSIPLLLFLLCSLLSAEEAKAESESDWTQLSYFERHNAKYKLTRYDPPIIMEWDHIPEDAPDSLKAKLPAIVNLPDYKYNSFEDWYEAGAKYKTKENIISHLNALSLKKREKRFYEYRAKTPNSSAYEKFYAGLAYANIVASLDIQFAGNLYCELYIARGPKPLHFFPEDAAALEDTVWRSLGKATLKFEDGIWKRHTSTVSAFPLLDPIFDLTILQEILEAGTIYYSSDKGRFTGFDPDNFPIEDSLREAYPGEYFFIIDPPSNFDFISHKTVTLDKILAGERFLYYKNPQDGGEPYPPGAQPKREVRSFLDFDPPPMPGDLEDTGSVATSEPESLEAPQSSQPTRPLWAYFIFAWAILATLALALVAVLALRRK